MTIKPLPAFNGDSILVSFPSNGKVINLLIDGGVPRTYQRALKPLLEDIQEKGEQIDLLIVTHIDDDHIGGIKELYQDNSIDQTLIKKIWFNSGKLLSRHFHTQEDTSREVVINPDDTTDMSVRQGVTLERKLENNNGLVQELISAGHKELFHGAELYVLSPSELILDRLNKHWETEEAKLTNMSGGDHEDFPFSITELIKLDFIEDNRLPNGSSIAFLLNLSDKNYLFLADAHPSQIERSLRGLGYDETNKLCAEFVKVSHHASKFNTSPGLLGIIRSQHFFISTDGSAHGLPNKEPLARMIVSNPGVTLHFNYQDIAEQIFSEKDFQEYTFTIKYSTGTDYLFKG